MKAATPRVVLISGCSSGIGLAAARTLSTRGHRVFASARKPADVARLKGEGFAGVVTLDLDDSNSIEQAVAAVLEQTDGVLEVLFNNAGFGVTGALEDLPREALRAQFETNVIGTQELTNRALVPMRRRGFGRIIQNSSVLGLVAMPYRGPYNASKFALEALSDTLRQELRGTGIRVSLVEPGPIVTRFRANALATFQRYIQDPEASHHRGVYRRWLERLQQEGPAVPFTLGPEAVVKKVVHAVESPRPKTRYYVTVPTYAFGFLRRFLPTAALDGLARRV